jgi:hypothetical protein
MAKDFQLIHITIDEARLKGKQPPAQSIRRLHARAE